jgi:hypothetical protein
MGQRRIIAIEMVKLLAWSAVNEAGKRENVVKIVSKKAIAE